VGRYGGILWGARKMRGDICRGWLGYQIGGRYSSCHQRCRWLAALLIVVSVSAAVSGCTASTRHAPRSAALTDSPAAATGSQSQSQSAWQSQSASPSSTASPSNTPAKSPEPLLSLSAVDDLAASKTPGYLIYGNARFGFFAEIPAGYVEQPPPENDDGREFVSSDETVHVLTWGEYNANGYTPQQDLSEMRQEMLQEFGGRVTYSSLVGNVATVSGVADSGDIFYARDVVGSTTIYALNWQYPASAQSSVKVLLEHSVATFHPGALSGYS